MMPAMTTALFQKAFDAGARAVSLLTRVLFSWAGLMEMPPSFWREARRVLYPPPVQFKVI